MRQTQPAKPIFADDRLMWLRLAAAVSLLALGGFVLTGCGDDTDDATLPEPAAGPTDPNAGMTTSMAGQVMGVDASGTYIPADPSMTMLLPTSPSQYPAVEGVSATENGIPAIPTAYRGGWANDAQGCGLPDGQWRFDELTATTPKGVKCNLTGLSNPAGSPSTTLILRCEGEGMVATEAWELSNPSEGKINFIRTNESSTTIPLIHCPTMAEWNSRRLHGVDRV